MPDPIPTPAPDVVPAPELPANPEGAEPSLIEGAKPEGEEAVKPEGEPAPKPPGESEPKAVEPIKIEDIKLPEGVTLDPEKFGKFSEFATANSLSKDAVQQLMDLHFEDMKVASEAGVKQYLDLQKQWVNEIIADPEVGGDKLPSTKSSIAKLIDDPRFSRTPEEAKALRSALTLTGAGNNPAMVKFWTRVANLLTESPTIQGRPPAPPKTAAQRMYPTAPTEQGV